jgi:Carboxypeptidase regulatory-like domain
MDTPSSVPLQSRPSPTFTLPRWLRVGVFVGLILLVQGMFAYLVSWVDPPRDPCFVSLRAGGDCKFAEALARLADIRANQPVVLYVSASAIQSESGRLCLLPSDASLDDPSTWLPLRDVLEKLKACPAKEKLLVLDLAPPIASAWLGYVYHDLAAAIPRELEAIADADRLVLCSCSPRQMPFHSAELDRSVFDYYVRRGLAGDADGYGDLRDGHITVKELTAFVQARVERWSLRVRGERQTPILHGAGGDFVLANIDPNAPRDGGLELRERDAPRAYGERRSGGPALSSEPSFSEDTKRTFDAQWRVLEQQLASAKPADAERIKKRFVEEMRDKLPAAELDAVVFAQALANPRLDPGTIRLCDQLLHPTPQALPRTAGALRLRQLADLAMRVEVLAWPRDLVETLLRSTDVGEKSQHQIAYLPGYVDLLEEPALERHAGEVRLWTRGYSNLDDAKKLLTEAAQKFERLSRLNEKWRDAEKALAESLAELPWYFEAMEALPELRTPWEQTASSARALAEALKTSPDDKLPWLVRVERLAGQIDVAEKHAKNLQQHRQALHAPFAKDALARLEQQCRSPRGDADTLRNAEALLSVAAPVLNAEDRATLGHAAHLLSRRLHEEILALDRQDNGAQRCTPIAEHKASSRDEEPRRAAQRARWQLALFELAGLSQDRLLPLRRGIDCCREDANNPEPWCHLGAKFRQAMSPLDRGAAGDPAKDSPTVEHRRREQQRQARWLKDYHRYVARDYRGLNLESPGVAAARAFYGQKDASAEPEPHVRLNLTTSVEPLTEKQPYSHVWLEVTRQVPAGAFGPVELQFQRTDDVWLEVAPDSATLPALTESKESRTLTHKVPLKATRKPKAERTGLPPPLGFLVEARFEGRSYHHLVTVPIVPSTQELQILVSADPDEPATTLNEIHVRPGKVKQPHYVYVQNLTNRPQKVHVEIRSGQALLHKSQRLLTLEPDGVRKVSFDESSRPTELHGSLVVRVLDQDRQKVLQERSLRVEVLSPHEYVKVAEALYEPGNKWAVQVQASRSVVGPAIAAQLVLPVQRIPGLMGIGGGTLHVELPTQLQSPRILFAEKLRMVHAVEEEGPVYLHIDGVPRAFVYRTTFSRTGQPNQPRPDDRPAVRLMAPPCVMAGVNCLVDVEVDNAPRGCKLEIALGRAFEDNSFKAEIVREFTDAKKRRIDLEASKDALVFAATIDDWTATFDTRAIVGARAVRARLIDAGGKELSQAGQGILIDDSPPIARIAPTPAQVKKGTALQVQAQAADPESGVAQVVFFFGRPDKGEIPLSAPRFKAAPANREATQWSATLPIPADHKGALAISIQVINHAGMATIDTVTLEVTDREPGKTGLGEIRGKVVEGPRPQPNLTVILTDERGKELARTRTQADGSYVFAQVAPGRYRVVCVKPESQRRAILGVIVEPDRMARADLALSL